MKFNENNSSFKRDFKKLLKKYNFLEEDFDNFKIALEVDGENLNGLKRIPLGNDIKIPIYKAKKFRSKNFRGKGSKSGIRITFSFEKEDEDSEPEVTFLEIYSKNGSKKNHDEKFIKSFCKEKAQGKIPP